LPRHTLEQREGGILHTLLSDQRHWSLEELQREFPDEEIDGPIKGLVMAGLAHRCGKFVFVSQAAIRGEELAI
jgi:hypothetical protein